MFALLRESFVEGLGGTQEIPGIQNRTLTEPNGSPFVIALWSLIMTIKNVLAGVAVRDIENAIRWYKMLLGRGPDTQPMEGLAEWQFDGGGWLQLNENKQISGRSSVTFVETNFEDRLKVLQKSGVEPKSVMRGDRVSVIIITDPDGNQIVFAQGKDPNHRATM
jgi:hypothetical protein